MPLPTPAGALAAAYRVLCLRCLRKQKTDSEHECEFASPASKKCTYCISQNAHCIPVSIPLQTPFRVHSDVVQFSFDFVQIPWFVGPEFAVLRVAESEDDICAAAKAIDQMIVVAALEAPKDQGSILMALLEETKAL